MKEVYEFLKKCGTYFIATTEGDQPRVRPFVTAVIHDDKLYIQTGRFKKVSQQMSINPKVEICACDGNNWMRIEAVAVDDSRIEVKRHMLEDYPYLKNQYKPEDEATQVLYLKDATATFYSFIKEPVTVRF